MNENKLFNFDHGSFRDPLGRVFHYKGRIFRKLNNDFDDIYRTLEHKKIINNSIEKGFLIPTWVLDDVELLKELNSDHLILEHKKIPFISFPYEWCFDQLKSAAIFHLEFQIYLLKRNVVLRDSSAYNIQFIGSNPIFIDVSSLSIYQEGSLWFGYKQFCEQFLYPLLLQVKLNLPFNNFFRGSLEGIDAITANKMIPMQKKFSLNIFLHLHLQAIINQKVLNNKSQYISKIKTNKNLSKSQYLALLNSLRNWIEKLDISINTKSSWINYETDNSYAKDETLMKNNLVKDFVSRIKPKSLIDLGCNTGKFSKTALDEGAEYVIGLDHDETTVRRIYLESKEKDYNILTLIMDATNPSPSQGWLELERQSFKDRFKTDSLLALAFIHHLAITKNIPIKQIMNWIIDIAPTGLIEFVPFSDNMVKEMMYFREDTHKEYSIDYFENHLTKIAKIQNKTKVSQSGRVIFEYSRKT